MVNLSWIVASLWWIRSYRYVGLWGCFGAIPGWSLVGTGVLREGPWIHRSVSVMVRGNPGSSVASGMTLDYQGQSRCHYGFTTVEQRTFTEDSRTNHRLSRNSHVSWIVPKVLNSLKHPRQRPGPARTTTDHPGPPQTVTAELWKHYGFHPEYAELYVRDGSGGSGSLVRPRFKEYEYLNKWLEPLSVHVTAC